MIHYFLEQKYGKTFLWRSGISDAIQFGIADEGIVDLNFRGKVFHLYLERGNQVKIKIDGKDWPKSLQIEGSLNAENTFYSNSMKNLLIISMLQKYLLKWLKSR
jgi:hypothetical protein